MSTRAHAARRRVPHALDSLEARSLTTRRSLAPGFESKCRTLSHSIALARLVFCGTIRAPAMPSLSVPIHQMRSVVAGVALLAFTSSGDAPRPVAAARESTVVVRIVRDTTFADELKLVYERALPGVQIELMDAIGSVETVDAIRTGRADLGFTFADVAYFAYLGRSQQPGVAIPPAQIRGVAALELVPIQLLARKGLPVHSVGDLSGYRVGLGTVLSRQLLLAGALFHAYGFEKEVVLPDRRTDLLIGADATFAFGYYPTG